jgi:MFS family permease
MAAFASLGVAVPGPAAGRDRVRPLRRPGRPQVDPGGLAAADGRLDPGHRLPAHLRHGRLAGPALLCLLRFGQGFGLGGEWGGAALLAVENAPPGWRARFGMFPQLGAPVGFIAANGLFLICWASS